MFKLIGNKLKAFWLMLTVDEQAAQRWLHGLWHAVIGFAVATWVTVFPTVHTVGDFFTKIAGWGRNEWFTNLGVSGLMLMLGVSRPMMPDLSKIPLLGGALTDSLPPPPAAQPPTQPPSAS